MGKPCCSPVPQLRRRPFHGTSTPAATRRSNLRRSCPPCCRLPLLALAGRYRELQKLCKQLGVRANGKKTALLQRLEERHAEMAAPGNQVAATPPSTPDTVPTVPSTPPTAPVPTVRATEAASPGRSVASTSPAMEVHPLSISCWYAAQTHRKRRTERSLTAPAPQIALCRASLPPLFCAALLCRRWHWR